MRSTEPYEHDIQSAYIDWVRLCEPREPALRLLYSVPNGAMFGSNAKLAAIQNKRLVAEGMRPGVPDVVLPVARGEYIGLYIEFKVLGRHPTATQTEFIGRLRAAGHLVEVVTSTDDAIALTRRYLAMGSHYVP